MGKTIDTLARCRSRGVPLVCVTTIDDHATADAIAASIGNEPSDDGAASLVWSAASGWQARNDSAAPALARMSDGADPYDPPHVACLRAASKAPAGACLVVIGGHHFQGKADAEAWIKAIRDPFESSSRTLVLLGPSFGSWGADVSPHVETIDDPPPDDGARETTIRSICHDAGSPELDPETLRLAVAGTRGLPIYGVKQACALAIDDSRKLDLSTLRNRWRKQINSTPGLAVDDTVRRLDDLGGLALIKAFSARLAGSKNPIGAIVLLDEGGKMLAGGGGAGGGGDTSGVSQAIEAALLTEMQDSKADGMIAFGVPGAGKSASAQALAAALAVPIIRLDLGKTKGSLVGETERNINRCLSTIRALVGTRAFWVMTCNELVTIKAEVQARFRSGIWFYDTPNVEERASIVAIYAKRHGLSTDPAIWPDLEGWVGREIETCAERAADWNITPREAAAWIVPVSQSSAERIAAMRKDAAGRYLSASYPGAYRGPQSSTVAAPAGRRFAKEG